MQRKLKYIADLLMLHGSFNINPGLSNGKMGIAIFLYHYSRFSNKKIYANFAGELLDQVFNEIYKTDPGCFQSGMTGIGWGIEYLVQKNFVKADTDEILNEMDEKIYSCTYNNLQNPLKTEDTFLDRDYIFLLELQETNMRKRTKSHKKTRKN